MKNLDVVLVGPYPPPFGGISAHVARLTDAIRAEGMTVGVLNHFRSREDNPLILRDLRRNPLRYWHALRGTEARIVHYHHARWSTLVATALTLHRSSSSTVATVHGRELEPYLRSRIPGVRRLTCRALERFDVLIAVSIEVERALQAVVKQPIRVLPAYIPAGDDHLPLSAEAEAFLAGGVNLLVSAYRLTVNRSGTTIYGLETAIDSFRAIARARPETRLAIFLAEAPRSRRESHRLQSLIGRVDDSDVRGRVGVFFGEPLAPALRMAALYLRPTLTDGDAVSVREAVAAGVPVLASDVVVRPQGVTTLPLELPRWTTAIEDRLSDDSGRVAVTVADPVADGSGSAPPAVADPLAALIGIYDRLLCRYVDHAPAAATSVA